MSIQKKVLFVTDDGEQFDSEEAALKHQKVLMMRPLVDEFVEELKSSGYRQRYVNAAERTLMKFCEYIVENDKEL